MKLDGGIVFFWHQVCNIKMTPVDRRISQENLFFGCVRPRVQILACYSGTAKRHILQSVRSTVKLRQERARSSSKNDILLRVPDGCTFLTGVHSSIRFDFLIAEGFVSRAPRVA